MSRQPNRKPTIHRHKSGNARVIIYRDGKRREVWLGRYGSPEAMAAYQRLLEELRIEDARPKVSLPGTLRTVEDLAAAYWTHADQHYRDRDRKPTSEHGLVRHTLRALVQRHGDTLIEKFGPAALKEVREMLVSGWRDGDVDRPGLCRIEVNQRIGRIKRAWKWAASDELIPPTLFHALQSVTGLQVGRSVAPDYEDVLPVSQEQLDATLPHLGQTVRDMVRVQLYTGMRAQEVCLMRPADIDREGLKVDGVTIWVYRPSRHKTQWRGHRKAVALGPQAQAVLTPYLARDPDAYLFSPREEIQRLRIERRKRRKTPVQPSQLCRAKPDPERQPGDCYTPMSYCRAIRQTCLKHGIPPWSTHQLRHAAAVAAERKDSLDAARAMLGHRAADTTTRYTSRDLQIAARIAAQIG